MNFKEQWIELCGIADFRHNHDYMQAKDSMQEHVLVELLDEIMQFAKTANADEIMWADIAHNHEETLATICKMAQLEMNEIGDVCDQIAELSAKPYWRGIPHRTDLEEQ